jgi:hypothetical protein
VVPGWCRFGFEIKPTSTPQFAPSMRAALSDLKLDSLDVVHARDRTFSLTDSIHTVALSELLDFLHPLRA